MKKQTDTLRFSVLMSVYKNDDPAYFNLAMKSVWDDQRKKPDQIVLVQDGYLSQDLLDVINNYKEKLENILQIVVLKTNLGLARALNEGLRHCKYDLIARMDSDDIAIYSRFNDQIEFFKKNKNISVCGGSVIEFNDEYERQMDYPEAHLEIVKLLKKRSPFAHMTVMYKKKDVVNSGGYPTNYPEDYALWSMMAIKGYKFSNLRKPLVRFRLSENMLQRRGVNFFYGITEILLFQKRIGLINGYELFRNIIIRGLTHLSPMWFRKILYKSR